MIWNIFKTISEGTLSVLHGTAAKEKFCKQVQSRSKYN